MCMEYNLLRTFHAVAHHASFSEAAHVLGLTQSAVSQHIAALEQDLGVVLLHRRPVAPTEAGTRLLDHAQPLLLRLDAARADMKRLSDARPSRLTIARTALAAPELLAQALSDISKDNARLGLSVDTVPAVEIPMGVAVGSHDVGLVTGAVAPSDPLLLPDLGPIVVHPLCQEELYLLLPHHHPLAHWSTIDLRDLVDARWIDAPESSVPLGQLRTIAGFGGFRADVHFAGSDVPQLVSLVAAGLGLAVLPRSACTGLRGVVGVPVASPHLVQRTELLHVSQAPSTVKALVTSLKAWTQLGDRPGNPGAEENVAVAGRAPSVSDPSWVSIITGLSPQSFYELIVKLRDRGADGLRRGRPWSLPLTDRVLLVAAYWRTDLTLRRVAALYDVSKSTADRIIGDLRPWLMVRPSGQREDKTVWIADGALITAPHRATADDLSLGERVVVDAKTRLALMVETG